MRQSVIFYIKYIYLVSLFFTVSMLFFCSVGLASMIIIVGIVARCRFAYGPADATATHYLLLQ